MLKRLEKAINRSPFYNFIRFNPVTDSYMEWTRAKTRKAVNFYASFLDPVPPGKLVFDIGANKGNKVKAFLKMGFRVVALEPEKKSLSTLHYRFGNNKHVTIVGKGVSDREGSLLIHIAEGRSGLNTLSDKWVGSLESKEENRWKKKHAFRHSYEVPVTTLRELFREYGLPYYVKIDVEGYEVQVLKGMDRMPGFLSFETNLPEFYSETAECIRQLESLSADTRFNYSVHDRLELPGWITAREMEARISDPDQRYMEIIARRGEGQ